MTRSHRTNMPAASNSRSEPGGSVDPAKSPESAESPASPEPSGPQVASRLLHPSQPVPQSLDTAILEDIAHGIAQGMFGGDVGVDLDDAEEAEATGGPRRQCVLATAAYDAWVLFWGVDAFVDLHDHEASAGVLHVVSGKLVEVSAALDPDARPRLRLLRAGDTSHTGPIVSHGLHNPGDEPAVTVNVYSPPLGDHGGRAVE